MSRKVSSTLVARRFWKLAGDKRETLTHLQYQKLVFLAHGWAFPFLDKELVCEPVEAWPLGPVFRELYDVLKKFSKGGAVGVTEIPESTEEWLANENEKVILKIKEEKLIDDVFEAYGHLSGSQLVTLTHEEGSPWYRTVPEGKQENAKGQVIESKLIKKFYTKEYENLPD